MATLMLGTFHFELDTGTGSICGAVSGIRRVVPS